MDAFYINKNIRIQSGSFKKGQLFVSTPEVNRDFSRILAGMNQLDSIKFLKVKDILKPAHHEDKFNNLLIIRLGGIGDLIALTSIIDYFEDKNIFFVTQDKYFPLFDWFANKPKVISIFRPVFNDIKLNDSRLDRWRELNCNGIIEAGNQTNWFELFFKSIGIDGPEPEFLRPQLNVYRISSKESNIQRLGTGKPSILICNKATAMMRTCKVSTIIDCIPDKEKYDIFVHQVNLDMDEKVDAIVIPPCDYNDFFLDCYDADQVISVDTGAIHFREGIEKPAIGLYNSFTTDSRTKYYEFTKSFDIKSDCDMQPCFIHETKTIKHCPKGNSFDAPCLSPEFNVSLKSQLTEILKYNL